MNEWYVLIAIIQYCYHKIQIWIIYNISYLIYHIIYHYTLKTGVWLTGFTGTNWIKKHTLYQELLTFHNFLLNDEPDELK